MTDLRTAAQQALEALEKTHTQPGCEQWRAERRASVALRAALEQPEQEPVADRAAFERHAESLGYSVDPDTRDGREGGYWSSHTHLMWETWQAALEQPEQDTDCHAQGICQRTGYGIGRPDQKPVAWMLPRTDLIITAATKVYRGVWAEDYTQPLYTNPPRREWVGLTEEDKEGFFTADQMTQEEWDELYQAAEAKLKEKNSG
jgi:hypothetical protein